MKKLLLATHNQGKVDEFQEMLEEFSMTLTAASDFDLPEPDETGYSFQDNALLKARAAASKTDLPVLADDSGLCVNALNGDPGIYSARWAGESKNFQLAMQQVQEKLADNKDRSAYFISVLALITPDGETHCFEGRVEGNLVWPPRGDKGFGYDPIFVAEGHELTFGEMEPEKKHAMSHRAIAVEKFKAYLLNA